jgi:TetR/AcrR family transcriptional regulator, regulator of biofilm formation and stress response
MGATAPVERRGEVRRLQIIEATLRILGARGPGAVTHRAVAEEAGVPLAATTYYFASKDELLREALGRLAAEEVERLREAATALEGTPLTATTLAQGIAAVIAAQFASRDDAVAKFEVYLEAARRPHLREAVASWQLQFTQLARAALTEAGARDPGASARVLVDAVHGLLLHELATTHGPLDEQVLAVRLAPVLDALL